MEQIENRNMIQEGKDFDEMLNYVKSKIAEPSRLGNGIHNNASKALSELRNDLKDINTFVHESLGEKEVQDEKAEDVRSYSLQVMSELESELDSMELAASRKGYIPFNLRNTSNSDIENTSRNLETPARKCISKKLSFGD